MATRRPSLNEGRGISPGDTTAGAPPNVARTFWYRSTKAGASAPATRVRADPHVALLPRSTKAGASAPATPPLPRPPPEGSAALNEGRGISPGDTRRRDWAGSRPPTLNEGRGISPGDTRRSEATTSATKTALNEGRGISPGDTRPYAIVDPRLWIAQRRPGHQPRRHAQRQSGTLGVRPRSTKAGASAPATRTAPIRYARCPSTLNEGRGISPGDTYRAFRQETSAVPAQRRPGHQPRRHSRCCRSMTCNAPFAQRRPGHQPRRHQPSKFPPMRSSPAQRRPGHQPRRHQVSPIRPRRRRSAQRRPGHQPRRHSRSAIKVTKNSHAQRRPGHQPRRHHPLPYEPPRYSGRSTKAGASAPATQPSPVNLA